MRSIKDLSNLSGRKALVAGGAGHIGAAAGQTLAELGATVAVLDLNEKACRVSVEKICCVRNNSGWPIACDLSDEKLVRRAVRTAISKMKGLDIIVHCAAYVGSTRLEGWSVPFEQQTVKAWDKALRINLTSAFVMAQEAREALGASGHGSVILLSSIYGSAGPDWSLYKGTSMSNPVGYGVSKGGVLQLVRYLATLLAPKVRVNSISPGGLWRGQPAAFCRRYHAKTPFKRMATEEDIKGAIAYLASDLSAYVTGHNLVVDGGWTAW